MTTETRPTLPRVQTSALDLPLSDLRVLEVGSSIAGAFCGKLLASLGAEVTKVEPPEGDRLRRLGPFAGDCPNSEGSLVFLYLNTNKKSITLRLSSETGRAMLHRLAADVDVILESLGPGGRENLGLSYEELAKLTPGLVVTSISDFGAQGPYRDFQGGELVLLALGGLLNMVGDPTREPLRLGGYQAQYTTALSAFAGTLAAVVHRDVSGYGQHVQVSVQESVAFVEWKSGTYYQSNGEVRRRGGEKAQWMVLRCQDGFVAFVYMDSHWRKVIELIADTRLADPRFETRGGRLRNRKELKSYLEAWTCQRYKADVYHAAQALDIPVGMVADMADLVASPQYAATGFFAEVNHPATGPALYPSVPFLINGQRPHLKRAPLVGEHNVQVYGQRLVLTTAELVCLRERDII